MEKPSVLHALRSIVFCGILCVFFVGTAFADGLQSKGKTRVGQPAGTIVHSDNSQKVDISKAKIPVSNKEKTSMLVRRNVRLQARKSKVEDMQFLSAEKESENRMSRERLVLRGNRMVPAQCAPKHAHERAVCIRDAQLRTMVRYQKTILKLSGTIQKIGKTILMISSK
jgi:hypothetical protein